MHDWDLGLNLGFLLKLYTRPKKSIFHSSIHLTSKSSKEKKSIELDWLFKVYPSPQVFPYEFDMTERMRRKREEKLEEQLKSERGWVEVEERKREKGKGMDQMVKEEKK